MFLFLITNGLNSLDAYFRMILLRCPATRFFVVFSNVFP